MPKISINKGQGVVRWDQEDWLAGLIPQHTTDIDRSLTGAVGLSYAKAIDPYRNIGFAIPGVNPETATNSSAIDSAITNGVADGTKAYLIAGTKLHELTISTLTVTNAGSWPHTITAHGGHSSVSGSDVILYHISGVKKLFYSWSDNTDGDVGMFDLSSTFDDDYMSAAATSGARLSTTYSHPMIVGDDDVLYILDGSNVHAYDGNTNTFTQNKLALPKNIVLTCTAKIQNYLVLFGYKRTSGSTVDKTDSFAFFWDYGSTDPTYSFPLPGNYPSAAFNLNGTVGCFITGTGYKIGGTSNKIALYTGSGFRVVRDYPFSNPTFGGVDVSGETVFWNGGDEIASYGSPYAGGSPILNRISIGTASSGFLKNFTSGFFYGTASGGGLVRYRTGYNSSAQFAVPFITPSMPLDYRCEISAVKVHWGAVASGGHSITVKIDTNKGATQTSIIEGKTVVTADTFQETYRYDTSGNPLSALKTDTLGFEVTYAAGASTTAVPPYLQALEIHFNLVKY